MSAVLDELNLRSSTIQGWFVSADISCRNVSLNLPSYSRELRLDLVYLQTKLPTPSNTFCHVQNRHGHWTYRRFQRCHAFFLSRLLFSMRR